MERIKLVRRFEGLFPRLDSVLSKLKSSQGRMKSKFKPCKIPKY
tara:strand:+ start:56304 stop:56435 length:132 start_codon:yes stop_codon:yes gene_type:complete